MYHLLDMVLFLSIICDNFLFLQGEMQQLRDKLAITERTARSEAQLKVHNLFVTLEQPGCVLLRACLLAFYLTYRWNLLHPMYYNVI
jgi:hypothetical protein